MKTYELQTYKRGAWKIDSMFDDPEIAVAEAKRVEESRRYSAVVVVEETYDEEKNRTTKRTIFRGGALAPPPKERAAIKKDNSKPASLPRHGVGKEPTRRAGPAIKHKADSQLGRIIFSTICVVVGLLALFGLHQLAQMG